MFLGVSHAIACCINASRGLSPTSELLVRSMVIAPENVLPRLAVVMSSLCLFVRLSARRITNAVVDEFR